MSSDRDVQAGPSARPSAGPGTSTRALSDFGSVQDNDAEPGAKSLSRSRSASPAGTDDRDHDPDHEPSGSSKPMKRSQVRHACWTCRTDKVKCSGTHPTCTRCSQRNVHCSYDVPEENMTKMQHLRAKILDAEQRLELVNAIFDILQKGSDEMAAEALARLRIGQTIDEVVNYMVAARPNNPGTDSPETTTTG